MTAADGKVKGIPPTGSYVLPYIIHLHTYCGVGSTYSGKVLDIANLMSFAMDRATDTTDQMVQGVVLRTTTHTPLLMQCRCY